MNVKSAVFECEFVRLSPLVPGITQDSLWVCGNSEQATLNIRQLCQAGGPQAGREQTILEGILSKVVAANSSELYPTVPACGISSIYSSTMFNHGTSIVLT